ncbi:DUF5959 family protein [Streptomyces sp. NBC_01334]|uniref:DUF5959 family protein n=1 Tax=Streptomyces sp. NBC_01334 TaxID=2903827 RepID=UPI003FA367D5
MTRATVFASRLLGPLPGVAGGLAAEIVVDTPSVSGRVDLTLPRSRLVSWWERLWIVLRLARTSPGCMSSVAPPSSSI